MPKLVRIPAPRHGLDRVSAPELVDNNSAPLVRNLFAHYPGRLTQRGHAIQAAVFEPASNGVGTYAMRFHPPSSPYSSERIAFEYDSGGNIYTTVAAISNSGSVSLGSPLMYNPPTFLFGGFLTPSVQFGDYAYAAGSVITGQLVRWNGDNIASGFTSFTNTPFTQPVHAAKYAERMWVADAAPVAGNFLYFSDPGGPTADLLSKWQDDISGLTNKIALASAPIALQTISNAMLVFTIDGTYVLTGTGSSSFALKKVSDHVLTQATAVCAYSDGCFFVAHEGLFFFDGVSERLISGPVQDKFTQKADDTGLFQLANVGNDFIFCRNDGVTDWAALYHVGTGAWVETVLTRTTLSTSQIGLIAGIPIGFDQTSIWDLRAAVWGANAPHGYDVAGALHIPIDSEWRTRTVRLGSPFAKAHVRRVVVDYAWASTSSTDTGWTYTIYTASPDQPAATGHVLATGTLPVSGSTTLQRKRYVIEVHDEAEDLWVELKTTGVPTADTTAELYDVWIEYDEAQQSAGF